MHVCVCACTHSEVCASICAQVCERVIRQPHLHYHTYLGGKRQHLFCTNAAIGSNFLFFKLEPSLLLKRSSFRSNWCRSESHGSVLFGLEALMRIYVRTPSPPPFQMFCFSYNLMPKPKNCCLCVCYMHQKRANDL